MNFSSFLNEKKSYKLNESYDAEQLAQYNKLDKEAEKIAQSLKSKLKHIPVNYADLYIEVGTRSFETKGIPALEVKLDSAGNLKISQSSVDFTDKSVLLYSDMLKEVSENLDAIKESLIKIAKLKKESYRI